MGTKRQPVLAHNQGLHSPPAFPSDPSSLGKSLLHVCPSCLSCLPQIPALQAKTLENKSIKTCWLFPLSFLPHPWGSESKYQLRGRKGRKESGLPISQHYTHEDSDRPQEAWILPCSATDHSCGLGQPLPSLIPGFTCSYSTEAEFTVPSEIHMCP